MNRTEPPTGPEGRENIDRRTVQGFGEEWSAFDQTGMSAHEQESLWEEYFDLFPFDALPEHAVGFDLGCGTGRWAQLVAPRVGTLHCIDPSAEALNVARTNLSELDNVRFHEASVSSLPLSEASQDFGYSLGVLHHVPDTLGGIRCCVRALKPGAPFLLYLYYAFDGRPRWYRQLWRLSNAVRRAVSKAPFVVRYAVTQLVAVTIYLPLARAAAAAERKGKVVDDWPLAYYRSRSLYTMRTDALDRFGTSLEHRFTRAEIESMMGEAGLQDIVFSEHMPFWCAVGYRSPG